MNPIDTRKIPLFIERLEKAGYILDVEHSKNELKITYSKSLPKHLIIPFGQTKLTDFRNGDLHGHGQNCSKISHAV